MEQSPYTIKIRTKSEIEEHKRAGYLLLTAETKEQLDWAFAALRAWDEK